MQCPIEGSFCLRVGLCRPVKRKAAVRAPTEVWRKLFRGEKPTIRTFARIQNQMAEVFLALGTFHVMSDHQECPHHQQKAKGGNPANPREKWAEKECAQHADQAGCLKAATAAQEVICKFTE